MKFKSARGWDGGATLQDAILSSYAPDGGMYVPEYLPPLTVEALRAWHALDFPLLAAEVLHLFMYADISKAELQQICVDAFKSFDAPEVLPVVRVDRFMVLELMHGPTLAFKDVGQQILGRLIDLFLRRQNATATVVVETSGDTGPAAIAGVQGLQNVQVLGLLVLHCPVAAGGGGGRGWMDGWMDANLQVASRPLLHVCVCVCVCVCVWGVRLCLSLTDVLTPQTLTAKLRPLLPAARHLSFSARSSAHLSAQGSLLYPPRLLSSKRPCLVSGAARELSSPAAYWTRGGGYLSSAGIIAHPSGWSLGAEPGDCTALQLRINK